VKALTVQQPFAWAIAEGHKLLENRSWCPVPGDSFKLGERIAIHAGASWHDSFGSVARNDELARLLFVNGGPLPPTVELPEEFTFGGVVAVAKVMRFVSVPDKLDPTLSAWFTGPWGWVLADVRRVRPVVEVKGALGLWHLSAPMTELVLGRMEERGGRHRHD
jgi:hypothetical protein